jgi:hydrogenase expression/formation protein HypD
MKFISEYRNSEHVSAIVNAIHQSSRRPIRLMEVCGTHTMAIERFGIRSLLPQNIELVSGPGCPVCVTSNRFIDHALALSTNPEHIICTFGDLLRVPGSKSSLMLQRTSGADIRITDSILAAIDIASAHPDKRIIFLSIGFETTTPGIAAGILKAKKLNLDNFFVLTSNKIMPPALHALINEDIQIDGFLCPGHVSAITGTSIYDFIVRKYGIACIVSGFEPSDILTSILKLINQFENQAPSVLNEYKRVVRTEGNKKARAMTHEVFTTRDDWWRGLGNIAGSGLELREKYCEFKAESLPCVIEKTVEPKGCICGLILKGQKRPSDCKLFEDPCSPANPIGACMVSPEGTCHAHYKYAMN